ncbi:MAG: 2-hydroxychromene-2-carboxylate isomerase [Bosea sp. (in: a-proteobacteria)]
MARHIDYFFTIASPWAYLGHKLLMETVAQHDVTLRWRPMPIAHVFAETGSLPLAKRPPARQRYRFVEMQRWRDKRGLPLVLKPARVPFVVDTVNRCIIALVELKRDPDAFVRLAFAGVWAEEADLADVAVIGQMLAAAGHDAAAVLALSQSPEIEAIYSANGEAAVAADVFGAPGYVLDGEVFWGQDRLELLADALASGRGPYSPV